MYADVILKDKSTMSWADFVEAINNPKQFNEELPDTDPAAEALKTAKDNLKAKEDAKDSADEALKKAEGELEAADQALTAAESEQTAAAEAVTAAQNTYTAANEEYTEALANQPDAKDKVADLQSKIDEKYADAIKDKQAQIDANKKDITTAETNAQDNLELMEALEVASTEPAPWLTKAEEDAQAFEDAYGEYYAWLGEHDPETETYTGPQATIYLNISVSNKNSQTFNVSFDSAYADKTAEGWKAYNLAAYEDDFVAKIDNMGITGRTRFAVKYYFGPDGNNQQATVSDLSNTNYFYLGEYVAKSLKTLENQPGYTVEGEKSVPAANQALYNKYKGLYERYSKQVEDLTEANKTLQGEIDELTENEKSDQLYTELETAQGELKTITDTITKYRSNKTPDGEDCKDASGNAITYLKYLQNAQTTAQARKTAADAAVSAALRDQTAKTNAKNAASTAVTNAENAITVAQNSVTTAQTAYNTAKTAYNTGLAAAAEENYKTVTLDEDITVSTPITRAYSGNIDGDKHIITIPSGVAFNNFNGILTNVAINGNFATGTIGAQFGNVAVNTGSAYRYYNLEGEQTDYKIGSLGQLGFIARDMVGVNFTTKKLVTLDNNTKVFDISIYSPTATPTQRYVVCDGTSLTSVDGAVTIPDNMFAESATADINVFPELANVFYQDGGNYVAENVVIKDKINFFAPQSINAKNVTLDREFKAGMNTVCFPFTVNTSEFTGVNAVCTYEREADGKFWFTYVEGDIPANTPVLMFASANTKANLSSIQIAKTESQIVEGNASDGTQSYGTFKTVNNTEFAGSFNADKIYGLQGGMFKPAASENVTFPAFRMVIASNTPATQDLSPVRSVRIMNRLGVDITNEIIGGASAVEDINAASSLSIVGGQGAIEFNSDADYGKVEIYNVNGGLVTVADVMAGTSSVNVEKGIYIVMGKKVMVK